MKKLFILSAVFAVFFMLATDADAQRRRRRSSSGDEATTSNTKRAGSNRRRRKSAPADKAQTGARAGRARAGRSRAGIARTANMGTTALELTIPTTEAAASAATETAVEVKKEYAVDLKALEAGANSVKVCQSKMMECVKGMLPEEKKKSVGLGLCYLSPKRYTFKKKEKTLRKVERDLFSLMGNAGFAKLSPKEQSIYKSLDMQFEDETDKAQDEGFDADSEGDSIAAMMEEMNEQMASLDSFGEKTGSTPAELFDEAFTSCKAVIDTCESVLGENSLKTFIKAKSTFACTTYDKSLQAKYRKQTLMLTQVKAKMKGDYLKARRKNMVSMQEGFLRIEKQLEGSVCGKGLEDCLYCGDNQTDEKACAAELVAKIQSQKPVIQDILDEISYGDETRGESIWTAFVQNKKTTINRFARMTNYSAKEQAVRGLEEATKQYRKEFKKCLNDVCGDDQIACADADAIKAGFDSLQSSKPIKYTVTNADGTVETKTMPVSEFSFDKLVNVTVDFSKANSACRDRIDLFANELRLLESNPNIDKALMPWFNAEEYEAANPEEWDQSVIAKLKQYADSLFRKVYAGVNAKATQNLDANKSQLLDNQLAFLAKRVEGYESNRAAELRISNADKETAIGMREKDTETYERDREMEIARSTMDKDVRVARNTNTQEMEFSDTELVSSRDLNKKAISDSARELAVAKDLNTAAIDTSATTLATTLSGNLATKDTAKLESDKALKENEKTREALAMVEVCYKQEKSTKKRRRRYINYSWSEETCKKFKPGLTGKCTAANFEVTNSQRYYSIRATSCSIDGEVVATHKTGSFTIPGGPEETK